MRFSAMSFSVKPGNEERIAEVFAASGFDDAFTTADGGSGPAGPIQAAGVFVQDGSLVIAFEHDGDYSDIARYLSTRGEIGQVVEGIRPYLSTPSEAGDTLLSRLTRNEMLCIQQRAIEERPGAQISALRYKVKPGHAQDIADVFKNVQAEARPTLRDTTGREIGVILVVALFVKDGDMIRVVQHDGELSDVAQYMAKRPARPEMERALEPYMDEERDVSTPDRFLKQFAKNTMRRVAFYSAEPQPAVEVS